MMAHLNYKPLLLKELAIRRLAANSFKESTILSSITKFRDKLLPFDNFKSPPDWRETVENKLADEISKLGLPTSLTELLMDTVKPMSRQLGRWKVFHEDYLNHFGGEEIHLGVPILEKVCWTAAGTVDYRRTAEEIIHSDVVGIVKKFRLACLYCLEDYIPILWTELPEKTQKIFRKKISRRLYRGGMYLEFWWPYLINGEESKLYDLTSGCRSEPMTFFQYVFQCTAAIGNKTAAEYFFQKLTPKEKGASLMREARYLTEHQFSTNNCSSWNFPREKFSELLSYLLSEMTPTQQIQIFQEKPLDVLQLFLAWPFQDMFSGTADIIWDFLPDKSREDLLHIMYKNSGDYCVKLFQGFFDRISPEFWIGFVDRQCVFGSYFDRILLKQDTKTLEIFLKSVDVAARKRLIFSDYALYVFQRFLSEGRRDVVEVWLRETNLSQEDRKRLKENFMRNPTSIKVNEMTLKTRKWSALRCFLDGDGKRSSEDETLTGTKRRKQQL